MTGAWRAVGSATVVGRLGEVSNRARVVVVAVRVRLATGRDRLVGAAADRLTAVPGAPSPVVAVERAAGLAHPGGDVTGLGAGAHVVVIAIAVRAAAAADGGVRAPVHRVAGVGRADDAVVAVGWRAGEAIAGVGIAGIDAIADIRVGADHVGPGTGAIPAAVCLRAGVAVVARGRVGGVAAARRRVAAVIRAGVVVIAVARRSARAGAHLAGVARGAGVAIVTGRAVGLEPVGRTAVAHPVAAVGHVAVPGCRPAHRPRVPGGVLAVGAAAVALVAATGVAVVGAGCAGGALRVGRTRGARSRAELGGVALTGRGAAEGRGGEEGIGRAGRARAVAGLGLVAVPGRRPAHRPRIPRRM